MRSCIYSMTPLSSQITPSSPTVVRNALTVVIRSSTPPSVALELQAFSIGEFFKAKVSDIASLEVGHKGATFMCARRSARLAVKCCGGSSELLVPRHHLPSNVVPRRRLVYPRSCSLCPLRGGASSGRCCFASATPPSRIGWRE
jgi:hypothetical protein